MKTYILKTITLATVLLFISCGKSKIKLNTADGISKTKELILEKFDPEKEVYSLSLTSEGDLSSDLGIISTNYLEEDIMYYDNYVLMVPEPTLEKNKNSIQGESYIQRKKGKVKIKDFDFDIISKKFAEGTEMIGEDYEGFVLANWYFYVDNDNKVTYNMNIEATKKGEGTSMQGRNIVTNFYEFKFDIDEAGKLTPKM